MNDNKTIRDIIVSRRNELGISLSEMARRLNIPKSTLSRYENLKHQYPLNEIQNFSNILDLTPEYILGLDAKENLQAETIADLINDDSSERAIIITKLNHLSKRDLLLVESFIDTLIKTKD
ncbi:helix-turn-helix domain-containing protein [Enterococcus sp. BWR-S5]|uniref:helix-turn-helix domain-containing protein n=1 Tax=Enterococcus sp. BWR-S5 TaxID=2787714 RepID=UPI0019235CA6|nr:helix-turn-helix transcriptional regulator [Enterococcus sp. BWR-S5]MBL1226579.1 helix-turn-helix transcriptional regulator [Enterococcus sp. BWR-S5]